MQRPKGDPDKPTFQSLLERPLGSGPGVSTVPCGVLELPAQPEGGEEL